MKKLILLTLLSATALGGCARVKSELGLTRRTPDEFAVVKRAPLEIPANLNQTASLPTPQPGMQRPQESTPEQAAQAAIMGGQIPSASAPSSAESAILQKAGATNVNPAIRRQIDREAEENKNTNRPVIKRLMNIGNKDDPGAASVVDAPAEARRLKQKNPGETPAIED